MSAKIFLSYRRHGSSGHTGRVADRLREAFGNEAVFQDIDSIRAGEDFVRAIEGTIAGCSAVLVMIGPDWLETKGERGSRLDDPEDFVRLEVASALRSNAKLIPVLVGGATMPPKSALPNELEPLTKCNALELRHGRFTDDIRALIAELERCTELKARSPSLLAALGQQVCESPSFVGQVIACVAAAVLTLLWPPPADLSADGSRAAGPLAGLVLLISIVTLIILQVGQVRGRGRYLKLAASLCFLFGVGLTLVYQSLLYSTTAQYDSISVVIGSNLTPMAKEYLEAHPGKTVDQLIADAVGNVESLWTRDSIGQNVLRLRVVYVGMMASFTACVLVFLHVVRTRC